MGRGRHRIHSMRKRVPRVGEENLHTRNQMHQMLMQMFWLQGKTCTSGCKSVRCWCKTRTCALGFHWISSWFTKSKSVWFCPWIRCWFNWIRERKFSLAKRTFASAADSFDSKYASFWPWPPILHQHMIHQHPWLQVPPQPPPLQHPAAVSSTAASNFLWVTKKLSYGISLLKINPIGIYLRKWSWPL